MNGSTGERPYRSHLQPACLPCRRRKSRCQTESDATACLMCRAHGTDCVYPGDAKVDDQRAAAPGNVKASTTTPAKRRRRSSALPRTTISAARTSRAHLPPRLPPTTVSPIMERTRLPNLLSPLPPITHAQPPAAAEAATTSIAGRAHQNMYDEDPFDSSADDQAQNLHIVGPAVTKDSQVLSDYLSAIPGATRGTQMIVPVPANRSRPVLFTRVQKRPLGVSLNRSPSAEKLEIIENLVGADAADMISLYFAKVNSCFPILDEVLFRRQYQANKDRISPALIATLFAHILVYWRHAKPEGQHRLPDSRFIWNLANGAVYSELHLSPGMSIIKAIILNIGGLPTTSLIGNGVLLGSAVSMALSLGLNHNPLPWEIPQIEKCLRMKIWWALLVHDRWTSLAHGTPPHISRAQYDVPPPTLEYIGDSAAYLGQNQAAPVFIALVSLTDVLDKHLQYIYSVDRSTVRDTTELELALNTWVESLSGSVRLIILRGSNLDTPGASNLRLSYLTTRLLLQRIELEADKQTYEAHDQRLSNRYIQARRTAEEILLFTHDLKPPQLGDFWLSTHAFSYPATVSFLLRCGLETASSPANLVQSASFRIAHELLNALRTHQEQHAWDLGAVCLAQHADIVDKILAGTSSAHESHETSGLFEPQDFVLPDVSIIDQFLPSLWDPLQNAW
ncbi:putative transcriptional regulatory protein-like protein [Emericellopsis cladophorae]|uniref:Transcriptional regulatory protein-like protein n=1 Tax=Emericellopsis cladophorae TaxID=2686198 RepID=A0A9Q0BE84_9HYPO|nr:putative transcriptional regulatory protein-like protein [Emericellopsis cladophorae]KAI6780964.1 putative transcriptional regulatory protein-like protein [Emericellopsis cladophorae]